MAFSLLTQPFEGGLPSSQISTSNPTGAKFDFVPSLTSGQTLQLDSTQAAFGSLSAKIATGAASATAYMDWTTSFAWQAQDWFAAYIYFPSNPAAAAAGDVLTFLQSSTLCARLRISTSGKVQFLDAAGTAQITSTASITLNAWVRIEGFLIGDPSAGQLEFKLFNTFTSTTPTETQTSGSALNTQGVPSTGRWGLSQSQSNAGPYWLDNAGLSALGYIGASVAVTDTDSGSSVDAGSSSAPMDSDSGSFFASIPFTGITGTETGTLADAGSVAVASAKSGTDTGTGSEDQHVTPHSPGTGPSFPLVFNMSSVVTGPSPDSDSGSFSEGSFVNPITVTAMVTDSDDGVFREGAPSITAGGQPVIPPTPTGLSVEGFSITHAGILQPGTAAELGVLYGVRSATFNPQHITSLMKQDDWVDGVWNAPGTLQVQITSGFIPFDVLNAIGFGPISVNSFLLDEGGATLFDETGIEALEDERGSTSQQTTLVDGFFSAGGVNAAVPMWKQAVAAQFPLLLRASGKDTLGNLRTVVFVAYAAQFSPLVFDGPVYKNGVTVSFTASLMLSATDEAGNTLPDRAYGRFMSLPQGVTGWEPIVQPRHHVSDEDHGAFINETALASQVGGSTFVSDSDFFRGAEGQRVTSSVVHLADTDAGRFTDSQSVATSVVHVSDVDFVTSEPRLGLVGSTTIIGEYGSPSGVDGTRLHEAQTFDGFIGRDMGIMAQKVYYQTGQFPTSYFAEFTGLVSAGCFMWLCYQPAFDGSDATALGNSIAALKAATPGGRVKVVLWQEPQNSIAGFPTAAQFISLMHTYYPVVQAQGVPLVYDAATHANVAGVMNYLPVTNGSLDADEIVCDYYCSIAIKQDSLQFTVPKAAEAQARKYNVPFGFGELGTALNAADAATVTQAQFTTYINGITSLMLGRAQTGLINSEVMWYNGDNTGAPTWNTITSSSDYRAGLLRTMFDSLSRRKTITSNEGAGEAPTGKVSTDGTQRGAFRGGRVAQLIGAVSSPANACPVSVSDWLSHGNPTIGPLDTDKIFYSGTQTMDTYQNGHLGSDNESQLPAGVVAFVTVKDAQISSLAQYVASVPDNVLLYICYWQEAEDSFPNGDFATFIKNFITFSNIVRSVGKANVRVYQDSGSFQYSNATNPPAQGKWRVPPQYVDAYTLDIYQDPTTGGAWPSNGLANYPRWLNWLNVFAGQGRPVGITEYGIGASGGNAQRNARLQLDCAYLRSAFPPTASAGSQVSPYPLLLWEYWWSNCSAGVLQTSTQKQHQFTDSTTISTWQQILAGSL